MKFFTFIIIILIAFTYYFLSKKPSSSTQKQLISYVMNLTTKELKEKYQFQLAGSGGGVSREGKERLIILNYKVNKIYTIEDARKLLLESIERLLFNVNNTKELLPYLDEVPFKAKNVEMAIFFHNKDYTSLFHPDLRMAFYYNNKISYLTIDPENDLKEKLTIQESYDEALEKVKAQK